MDFCDDWINIVFVNMFHFSVSIQNAAVKIQQLTFQLRHVMSQIVGIYMRTQ